MWLSFEPWQLIVSFVLELKNIGIVTFIAKELKSNFYHNFFYKVNLFKKSQSLLMNWHFYGKTSENKPDQFCCVRVLMISDAKVYLKKFTSN